MIQVLRKPLITSEIYQAARQFAPRIQLRDVWFVLREMEARQLVQCLNPEQVTGKLYCLTKRGRRLVNTVFSFSVPAAPLDMPWKTYSLVVRAKTRRVAVLELSKSCYAGQVPAIAANLRKRLRQTYPIGLNPLLRTLKDLVKLGVIAVAGTTIERQLKIYCLTAAGNVIARELQR